MSSSAFDPFDGVVGGTAEAAGAAEIVSASKGYRTAFDSAPIGIAFVSPEGRWLQVNRALCQLVGYTEEQLLELNISSLTHPDDSRRRWSASGGRWRDARRSRIEKRYVRADGTTVWVAVTSTLVRDAAGAALYSVAQIENINDRVHAQAALGEAEERFRRAFNDAPIGMGLVAPDGRWLRVNERLTEITASRRSCSTRPSRTSPIPTMSTSMSRTPGSCSPARCARIRWRSDTCDPTESDLGDALVSLVRGMTTSLSTSSRRSRTSTSESGRAGADPSRGARLAHRSAQPSPVPARAGAGAQASPPVPRPSRDPLHRHRPLQACQRHARPQGRRRRPPVDREEARPPSARHGHHRPSRR